MDIKIAHLIKDSIHATITFSPTTWKWAEPIINSYEFLRLSRIMQLGTTFKTFPSAVHTRYNHCLGVYEVARRMLVSLCSHDNSITEKQVQTVLAAAMLHDIGHGPLSHCFESFYTGFNHEKIGIEIITNKGGIIYKSLKNAGIDPNDVANLLAKKDTIPWMQSIISSQLDCDRLDYLLRDSHNTGVSYGIVDISILMKWIKKIDDRLIYDNDAVNWIENFLLSRYHMFMQIYCNDKNLKNDSLVTLIFKRLKELEKENKQILSKIDPFFWNLYEPVVNHKLTMDIFLKLDDYNLHGFIQELTKIDDELLNKLVIGYLYNQNYKVEISSKITTSDDEKFVQNDSFENYSRTYKIVSYLFDQKNQIKLYNHNTNSIVNFSDSSKIFSSEKMCAINKIMLNYTLVDTTINKESKTCKK